MVATNKLTGLTQLVGQLSNRETLVERLASDLQRLAADWANKVNHLVRQLESINWNEIRGGSSFQKVLVGEGGLAGFGGLSKEMATRSVRLLDELFEQHLLVQDLHDRTRDIRLLDVGQLFGRYPRVVRDLASSKGKKVETILQGTEVGVDKQVLDQIDEVLIHLLNNSIDHGIELPEDRLARGKSAVAKITLAARSVGEEVEITITDDGRGVDYEEVKTTLLKRGIVNESEVSLLTKAQLLVYLFEPGFSTASKVSETSGRGVGLDAVKEQIKALGGTIRIATKPGSGTRVLMRIPVSLTLSKAFLVQISAGYFAIPSFAIVSLLQISPQAIESAGDGKAFRFEHDRRIPLVDLSMVLGFAPVDYSAEDHVNVLVLFHGDTYIGVIVKRFIDEQSVVQKSLNPFLSGVRSITGTAIIAGGELVSFLNVSTIFEYVRKGFQYRRKGANSGSDVDIYQKRILIVEDSDLTREMLISVIGRLGFETAFAVNGQDALAKLDRFNPDLIMTDIDMPVMNGFELIRRIRSHNRFKDLPIMVLSTRDSDEDKTLASQAGADAYLVKSMFKETEFIRMVESVYSEQKRFRTLAI